MVFDLFGEFKASGQFSILCRLYFALTVAEPRQEVPSADLPVGDGAVVRAPHEASLLVLLGEHVRPDLGCVGLFICVAWSCWLCEAARVTAMLCTCSSSGLAPPEMASGLITLNMNIRVFPK